MYRPKLFLIDANGFCYRAFFAIRNLATSYGQPTNAVYGFVTMLKKILQKESPDYIGVCFDVSKDTFRKEKFTDYKINRPPMPDGLSSQIPLIKDIILAYNLPVFELKGYEADDVIATIVNKTASKDLDIFIVSSDKDILQLVNKDIKVYSPHKDEVKIYDDKEVKDRFKIMPESIVELIALMGDKADNIPGVTGIGEMTAVKLLEEFGDLDGIYANLDKIKSDKLRQMLKEQKQIAFLSKELAKLDNNIPLKIELDNLRMKDPDYERLFKLFKDLEFKSLLKDLPVNSSEAQAVKIVNAEKKNKLTGEFAFFIPPSGLNTQIQEISEVFFCDKQGEVVKAADTDTIRRMLKDSAQDKSTYDFKNIFSILSNNDIRVDGKVFDVMIASYLLDPTKANYPLEDIAFQYLNIPFAAEENAANAAGFIFQLKPILEKELKEKSLSELFYNVEMPLASVLAKMQLTGVKIDKQFLKELSKKLEKRMIELIEEIYDIAGTEFNINSPKQLAAILFEKLKLPVIKKTKTGTSTDEEVLRRLSDKHILPQEILEYRQLVKLKSTYVDALPKLAQPKTDRIHATFNQTGTETGRLSSSDPNLQNLPIRTDLGKEIRRSIIASKVDNLILSADYSQVELRILAHLSGDENLISAFKKGDDIHRYTASLIYDRPQQDISDQMRDVAKRINFGIIYGMSSYGLAKDLAITMEAAQGFIDAYFIRYPGVKKFMQEQIDKAKKDGFVTTLLGRCRYIPQINNKNSSIRQSAERQAINTPVQGSAADLIKLAMIKLQDELEKKKLDSKMILQVHDELVFEIPKKELSKMNSLVKEIMENVIKLSIPIVVSIKAGRNWLEMEEVK